MHIVLVAVDTDTGELVTTERVGIVLRALWIASSRGKKLTTAAVARLVNFRQWRSADEMMLKLERVFPELRHDLDGWWIDMAGWGVQTPSSHVTVEA